jgi:DDE superfamily endonuclease
VVPGRLLFFSILSEIIRRRGLGQHPGNDLIGQALKGLMNTSFQVSKLRRMVPQLGNPFHLLLLQLLLQLPQHFVNVRHHRTRRSFETHFHLPPAIRVVYLSAAYLRLTLSTDVSDGPFSGIGPFVTFLMKLIAGASRKLYVIADHLKVHESRVVDEWLENHQEQIELFSLPRRAPELNPVEYLNQDLKSGVNAEKLPEDKKELRSNIQRFMHRLVKLPEHVMSYFENHFIQYASGTM